MSSPRFEAFLARLYCEGGLAEQFIARPERVLADSGLDARECAAARAIDPLELRMACRSFAAKRGARRPTFVQRLRRVLRGRAG